MIPLDPYILKRILLKKMAANKRTDKQIENDRLFISEQFLKGFTIREISENLNKRNEAQGYDYTLVHSMVAYDIKKVLEEWRENRKQYIDLLMERDLQKLEMIERECWDAWQASKNSTKKTTIKGGAIKDGQVTGGTLDKREMEDSNGDPRYIDRIFQCMDRRRELLGYGSAKKIEHSGTVNVGIKSMDSDEMKKEKARIKRNWELQAVS